MIGNQPLSQAQINRQEFTLTEGQTVVPCVYTQGFEQLYLNGVLLKRDVDYTTIPAGTQITLVLGATAGDECTVIAYTTFAVTRENQFVKTKAEFFAQLEQNKDQYAGSGFAEWGRHDAPFNVNEGMTGIPLDTNPLYANNITLGRPWYSSSIIEGVSRTHFPLASANGVLHAIRAVNASDTYSTHRSGNSIKFPTAPTANQLVTNGTFDTGDLTSFALANGSTLAVSSARLEVLNASASNGGVQINTTGWVSGQTYLVEFLYTSLVGAAGVSFFANNTLVKAALVSGAVYRFETVWNGANAPIIRYAGGGQLATDQFAIDNVSVIDTADLSRQDLCFLESWHEKVTDKDWVAPYGNVQYGATSFDGITLVNNVVAAGYSAFGEWESSPVAGYGASWSTLSDADRQKFLADPYNNLYLDDDGSLVQVRYRIRTVAGQGDDWSNTDPQTFDNSLAYSGAENRYVQVQGSQTSVVDIGGYNSYNGHFLGVTYVTERFGFTPTGAFYAATGVLGDQPVTVAVDGLCFAVPIALVQRRNQGAYHPVFNENGCNRIRHVSTAKYDWYNVPAAGVLTSTQDCMSIGINYTTDYQVWDGGGSIGTTSGRPDGLFYDAIYATDVKDLRNSAHKVQDYNRLLERELNRLVVGEARGFEGERKVQVLSIPTQAAFHINGQTSTTPTITPGNDMLLYTSEHPAAAFQTNISHTNYGMGSMLVIIIDGEYVVIKIDEKQAGTQTLRGIIQIVSAGMGAKLVYEGTSNYYNPVAGAITTVSGEQGHSAETILHCDIIGDPANYPQEWKDHGVFGTPLLVGEDGTSYVIPSGTLSMKASRKVKDNLIYVGTYDGGATWITGATTFNSTTNEMLFDNGVYLAFYTTKANPTELATNSEVLALGDVWAGQHNLITLGNVLTPSLIGKVGDSAGAGKSVLGGFTVDGFRIATHVGGELSITSDYYPTHSTVALDGSTSGPAAKVLPYLSRENGRPYLHLLYKELVYDSGKDSATAYTAGAHAAFNADTPVVFTGLTNELFNNKVLVFASNQAANAVTAGFFNGFTITPDNSIINATTGASSTVTLWDGNGWGDNNKFTVLDNESTETDDNGNTIIIGQKRITLPNFINDEE